MSLGVIPLNPYRGIIVDSYPQASTSKGLKCQTILIFFIIGFYSITKHLFKVNMQFSKFINSQHSKFHSDKKIIFKYPNLNYESYIKLFRI